jgi:transcriptional repressor NF-X1
MSAAATQGANLAVSAVSGDSQAEHRAKPSHPRRRPRQPKPGNTAEQSSESNQTSPGVKTRDNRRPPRQRNPQNGAQEHSGPPSVQPTASPTPSGDSQPSQKKHRPPRFPRPPRPQTNEEGASALQDSKKPGKKGRRAPRFGAGLTEENAAGPSKRDEPSQPAYTLPKKNDLTSTLIHDLSTPPYPDCLICFSAIRPQEPTFSCSPTIPIASDDEAERNAPIKGTAVTAQCCWTTFHLKCIKAWAVKSVKETEAAWKARGEDRLGVWRCPGCQVQRNVVPSVYR